MTNANTDKKVDRAKAANQMMIFWNGIKTKKGEELYKGRWYFYDSDVDGNHYRFTAKEYGDAPDEVLAVFEVVNNTDIMTDYFEKSHFKVDANHPCFHKIEKALEKRAASVEKAAAKAAQKAADQEEQVSGGATEEEAEIAEMTNKKSAKAKFEEMTKDLSPAEQAELGADADEPTPITKNTVAAEVSKGSKAVEEKPVNARQARMIAYRACAANIRINIEWMLKEYPQDELSRKRISDEIGAIAQNLENQGRRIETTLSKAAKKAEAK